VKCTSTSSLNTFPKTSTVVHGPLQKSGNQCLCLKSNSTCINVCGHLHIFIPWEYVIGISNHRISSWIRLGESSNYVILEVRRFLSSANQMLVISVPDTIVLLNLSLGQRIIQLLLALCPLFVRLILDIWSTGCVMAELLTGSPLFPGESGIDQLVEIIKVLGTPSREQIRTMNPNYMEHKFPQIKPHPFNRVPPIGKRELILDFPSTSWQRSHRSSQEFIAIYSQCTSSCPRCSHP